MPHATIKIYLTAAPEERARRRWLQQRSKGIGESYEEALAAVKKRDYDDSHRAAAPLCRACLLYTSGRLGGGRCACGTL